MTESGNRGRLDRSADINIIAYLIDQVGMPLSKKAHTIPISESDVLVTALAGIGQTAGRHLCGCAVAAGK